MGEPAIRQFDVAISSDMDSPATDRAIAEAGEMIRNAWENLAARDGLSTTGKYMSHIGSADSIAYPYLGDRDQVAVIHPLREAAWLEWGRSGFHLPQRWGSGKGKWKISKDGRRYAIISFRHRTPYAEGDGSTSERQRMAMPVEIYNTAKKLEHGQRLKLSDTVNIRSRKKVYGTAEIGEYGLQSKSYDQYRRAYGADAVPEHLPQGYTWKSPKFAGLTRTTDGEGKHGQYNTYRVMTEDSPGWYIPPMPAHHYSSRALDAVSPVIEERLKQAAYVDAAMAVHAAVSPLES